MSYIYRRPGLELLATSPAHYERDQNWQQEGFAAADERYTLQSPNLMTVNIDGDGYVLDGQQDYDLTTLTNWDNYTITDWAALTAYEVGDLVLPVVGGANCIYVCAVAGTSGAAEPAWSVVKNANNVDATAQWTTTFDNTVAAQRAGYDHYVYACVPAGGTTPDIILSDNVTIPIGYTADNSRKISGFHCECVAIGVIGGHVLTGYVAGDILPLSVWDLNFKSVGLQEGTVYDERTHRWAGIYMNSGTGVNTVSVYGATATDTRNWMDFVDDCGAVGCTLPTDDEFQIIARGSNEETNIAGGADPVTTGGHLDTAGRRMTSDDGCEDCCGAWNQWTRTHGYRADGLTMEIVAGEKTATVYHDAVPDGNQIYLKFDNGQPYLCCNMANDTVDKIITLGTNYKITIVHDVGAAGGLPIYFDDDATQPSRLLVNNTILTKDCYILSNSPSYMLKLKHDAGAAGNGSALHFDDGGDERLESNCAGTANAVIDLAYFDSAELVWAYENLPGAKGSLYKQGTYGDAVLHAGGSWNSAAHAGSRYRNAHYYRWIANAAFGCRVVAEAKES